MHHHDLVAVPPRSRSSRARLRATAQAAALLCGACAAWPAAAQAQERDAAQADLERVIVTGTRGQGTKAVDSVSPIAVLSSSDLVATGQSNVLEALKRLEPTFNALARGGDFSNIVRSANLRGLGANQTLVLVNGKRRHTTAYISAAGNIAADLDFIPVAAIERIEILKDGAAAQYGSDAIGGVLNIILKNSDHGGEIATSYGRFHKSAINPNGLGHGRTRTIEFNKGFKLDNDGFLNLTLEGRDKLHTNQTGPDLRVTSGDRYPSKISGDAAYTVGNAAFNGGLKLDGDLEAYAFGTFGQRQADSWQNYRLPTAYPALTAAGLYPNGFAPDETTDESDYSISTGLRGRFGDGGRWDLGVTHGNNKNDLGLSESVNPTLFADTGRTPTEFYLGQFANRQTTVNLDASQPVAVDGLAAPLLLAGGLEFRNERFSTRAGDFASTYKGGSIAYVGLSSYDAASHSRKVIGAYVDASVKPLAAWQVGAALRGEHYSDFGYTFNGKLSSRYDFGRALALRGTASTGYRAPTLAEEYYSATTVSPTLTTASLPANSAAAKIAGADNLTPEKSRNLSLGVVGTPTDTLRLTADAYVVSIKDRIVKATGITGAAADAAIAANGITIQTAAGSGQVAYFANGVDTRTTGLDLTAQLTSAYAGWGTVKWGFAGSFLRTKITQADAVYLPPALSTLTDNTPRSKLIASADWRFDQWTFGLDITRYGESSQVSATGSTGRAPYYRSVVKPAVIADVSAAYEFASGWRVQGGANNLFNKYPEQVVPQTITPAGAGVLPGFSPYGYNGAYYHARVSYKF